MCAIFGISMILLRRASVVSEMMAALVTTELSIVICFVYGHVLDLRHAYMYSITAMCYFYFIQIPQLTSLSRYRFFVCTKQICYVVAFGLWSGEFSMNLLSDMLMPVLPMFCLFLAIVHQLDINRMHNWFTQLEEAKQQLNAIITAVPVGLIVINQSLEVTHNNAAADRLLNCQNIDDVRQRLASLVYLPGNRAYTNPCTSNFQDDFKHYLDIEAMESTSFGLITYDEKILSLIGSKTTWKGENAVVLVIKNVTEMLQLEQARAESQYKNLMLRSVSHELRTPTNGILHTVTQVCEATSVPQWAKDKLKIAEVCSKQLLFLIDDLLDYSQLILGRFTLVKAVFPLRDSIRQSFEMVESVAQQKQIHMVLNIDPLLPEKAYSDSKRLSQVLVNLLTNAVKYTQTSGRIELAAHLDDSGFMQILVKDNGLGIPTEHLRSAFKVFGYSDESSAMNTQGCGLGLHISNILAGMLGNQPIRAESELGRGSLFTFTVDIYEGERYVTLPTTDISQYTFDLEDELKHAFEIPMFYCHSKDLPNVLVVDDTPFNRMVVKDFLRTEGLDCLEVESGKECIEVVMSRAKTDNPVKLIVMDFEMPEMDGPSATRLLLQILGDQGFALPNIVAHTAYVSHEDQVLCLNSGMVAFIPKPTTKANFLSIIRQYLR